jgi:hypothetical protein
MATSARAAVLWNVKRKTTIRVLSLLFAGARQVSRAPARIMAARLQPLAVDSED